MGFSEVKLLRDFNRFLFCRGRFFGKTSFKAFNTAGGINHLIISGIQGVAITADFYVHLCLGGTNRKRVTARADNLCLIYVFWVDFFLHENIMLMHELCEWYEFAYTYPLRTFVY